MTAKHKKICWTCLATLSVGLLIMYVLTSCRDHDFDDLQTVPDVVYAGDGRGDLVTRGDLGYHFNYQRGRNSQILEIPTDVNVFMLDNKFREVDYYWFRKFNNWFQQMLHENNMLALGGAGETADCDNYAMLYKSLMSVAAYKAGESVEPAVLLVLVEQRESFGGVPAGGAHLCVLVMTDQGWFVVEPQTGQFDKLENYPNQRFVRLLMI